MIIITEHGLYPDLARIEGAIKKHKTPREKNSYGTYASVYFHQENLHLPLPSLAVAYGNENTFNLLASMPDFDPNVTELSSSVSLFRLVLECAYFCEAEDKSKYKKILLKLLKSRNLDWSGVRLYHRTVLHYVAQIGDVDLSITKEILKVENNFSYDIFGSNPLFTSIQEKQYQTTEYILNTFDKNILMQALIDGTYPLEIACSKSTDLNQGLSIITKMLDALAPEFYQPSPVLFSAIQNENKECSVAFVKLLLSRGVNPNVISAENDPILNIIATEFFKATDAQHEAHWLQILDLLLTHGLNVFIKTRNNQFDFISETWSYPQGKKLVNHILKHFSKDEETLKKLRQLIKNDFQYPNDFDERHREYENRISRIGKIQNSDEQVYALLKLKNDLGDDWIATPPNSLAEFRKNSLLLALTHLYSRGFISTQPIFEIIKIFRGMQGAIYKNALPFLYQGYLIRSLTDFSNSSNKGQSITHALMIATQFVGSFEQQSDEDRLCFINELNDILQRIILLALLEVKQIHKDFSLCLTWLSKIPEDYFDTQTQLLILELKITQAYFQGKLQDFNLYFQQFPASHLLQRQYLYWQLELLFKQNINPPTIEYIEELDRALVKLNNKYSDIPVPYTHPFKEKLAAYRRQIAPHTKPQKEVKKPLELSSPIVQAPILLPEPTVSISNNNNNPVGQNSLMLNQTKLAITSDPVDPIVKAKRRHQYVQAGIDAISNLMQQIKPHKKQLLYTEKQIREKFKAVLQDGEILKSLTYRYEEGICWAICHAEEAVYTKLAEHFTKKFAECYEVKMGHANSGISCEKEPNEENGVIRLKLGRHDERLQGPIYRLAEVEGKLKDRCFLIVFNKRWVHGEAFKQEEIILEPPKPVNANEKRMKNN
ncbi:MAG: hypothetical protein WC748_07155 [Legionellales bacterium]|jgi:hypothetical protein